MPLKEKVIGLILVIVGAIPTLLKIESFAAATEKYAFLKLIIPGTMAYQAIIILLGISLIWTLRHHVRVKTRR